MKNSVVEKILRAYNEIDLEIGAEKFWIKEDEECYKSIRGINYDGMPKSSSSSPDGVFEQAAACVRLGIGDDIKRRNANIQDLKILKTQVLKEVSELKPLYKTIIYLFYIQDNKWEYVAKQVDYSVRHCKNIRCEALKVLGEKFERNLNISQNAYVLRYIY